MNYVSDEISNLLCWIFNIKLTKEENVLFVINNKRQSAFIKSLNKIINEYKTGGYINNSDMTEFLHSYWNNLKKEEYILYKFFPTYTLKYDSEENFCRNYLNELSQKMGWEFDNLEGNETIKFFKQSMQIDD